jgi:hypothetical protein
MLRFLARLLGLVIGVSIVAGIVSALAALNFKKKAPQRPEPGADEIDFAAVMEGAEFVSSAPAFRGGRVICWYAGVDLDLREATLDAAGAELDVRTIFGGTRIVVAPGTPVRVSGPAIFGGAMNSTGAPEASADAPGLVVSGLTLFGGLQVIASERGEEIPAWAGERDHEHLDEVLAEPVTAALEVADEIAPA